MKLPYRFVKLALQELASSTRVAPAAAIAAGASRVPAAASSCTSTAAITPGWPGARRSGFLIAVIDDATKRILYGQLWPADTTHAAASGCPSLRTHHWAT